MLFNSFEFIVFFFLFFIAFWALSQKSLQSQNLLIVFASYIFYGWWDWRFLSLIFISTLVDFYIGFFLSKTKNKKIRKTLLLSSLTVNIGLLGFFKYYNFFIENFNEITNSLGFQSNMSSLNIILPVGISFYTFQTLSYTIDVYKNKISPTSNFISFAAFVSFFPQLVAGPIERASHLLPQFSKSKKFDYLNATDGLRQVLWGLFKKVVIADNCAVHANAIFDTPGDYSASTLLLGGVFFAFQIYGDFSGYSDIAIGIAKMLGFDLMKNFAFPYFSRDIAEFWRRWHISLSTWFRDYLYIPLGGSKGSTIKKVRNTFVIFIVSGFWHGANWTFIIWGTLNAFYFLPLLLTKRNRKNLRPVAQGRKRPSLYEFFLILKTFFLTVIAWIFFRSESLEKAFNYLFGIFSQSLLSLPSLPKEGRGSFFLLVIFVFIFIEWKGREDQHALEKIGQNWQRKSRWFLYYAIMFSILLMPGQKQEFIYFQF